MSKNGNQVPPADQTRAYLLSLSDARYVQTDRDLDELRRVAGELEAEGCGRWLIIADAQMVSIRKAPEVGVYGPRRVMKHMKVGDRATFAPERLAVVRTTASYLNGQDGKQLWEVTSHTKTKHQRVEVRCLDRDAVKATDGGPLADSVAMRQIIENIPVGDEVNNLSGDLASALRSAATAFNRRAGRPEIGVFTEKDGSITVRHRRPHEIGLDRGRTSNAIRALEPYQALKVNVVEREAARANASRIGKERPDVSLAVVTTSHTHAHVVCLPVRDDMPDAREAARMLDNGEIKEIII